MDRKETSAFERAAWLRRAILIPFAPLLAIWAQEPTSVYAGSQARIARRQGVDDRIATPRARSILLTSGNPSPRAFLLLHGLTDSPRQFEQLAQQLFASGSNTYVPRFPQHGLRGKDARALSKLTAAQLRGFADSIVQEARGLGDSLTIVGLSMGGTVGAWIAQRYITSRVVLIAPAITPGRIPSILDRPLIGLADHLPSVVRRSQADTAYPDRELGFNSRAIAAILSLGEYVLDQATRTAPLTREIVLLVNANDRTVNESTDEQLARNWLRQGVEVAVYELPDSLRLPHNIIDPINGRVRGEATLALLTDLAYGRAPAAMVRRIVLR